MKGLVILLVSRHAGDNSDYLVRLDQFFSVPSCVPCLLADLKVFLSWNTIFSRNKYFRGRL